MSHPMPTAVTQGTEWSTAYPFSNPSSDVRGLLTDLYLCFPGEYEAPLRVDWLYGFGTDPGTPPSGVPAPENPREIRILDNADKVVFDSTVAEYAVQAWGDRTIVQWQTADSVCRVVIQDITESEWPDTYRPDNGKLDARTWHQLPARVVTVVVNDAAYYGKLEFLEGFNVGLGVEIPDPVDGGRKVTQITFDATPGLGEGTKPGCEDETQLVLRRINNVGPDPSGNFVLDMGDCLRLQIPVTTEGVGGEKVAYYGGFGLSNEEARHAVVMFNDCHPCCECEDYANAYLGVKNVWNAWKLAADKLSAARDKYSENKGKWSEARQCAAQTNGRLVVIPEGGKWQISGNYGNNTKCCLSELEIRFTVQMSLDGEPLDPGEYTLSATSGQAEGSGITGVGNYELTVTGSLISAFFTNVPPQGQSVVRFRLCVRLGDGVPDGTLSGTISMSAHAPDAEGCDMPDKGSEVPEDVQALWGDAGGTVRFFDQKDLPVGGEPKKMKYSCASEQQNNNQLGGCG